MPRLTKKFFKAKDLRRRGYSLKEISEKLNIAKSTASIWLQDIELSKKAIDRLKKRKFLGALKTSETKRLKREKFNISLTKEAFDILNSANLDKNHLKLLCALLFECEGTKDTRGGIYFSNSNPEVIKAFLTLLRLSFDIKEEKLRIVLHLHSYHSQKRQIIFWSKVTNIPKSQFSRPYQKPHTGKRVKNDYQGCVSIRYYDSILARKLSAISKVILKKYGRVG